MASIDVSRVKIGPAVLAAPSSKSVKSFKKRKKKKKKDETSYVEYMYLRPQKFFRNQILLDFLGWWDNQSCQIFFQSVYSGVFGEGSNIAIFSANRGWSLQLLYYRTTVIKLKSLRVAAAAIKVVWTSILDPYWGIKLDQSCLLNFWHYFSRNYVRGQKVYPGEGG